MNIIEIDEKTYDVDGAAVWISGDGIPRCVECSGPLVAMSASCRHARAVKRLTKRAVDGAKAPRKSKRSAGSPRN